LVSVATVAAASHGEVVVELGKGLSTLAFLTLPNNYLLLAVLRGWTFPALALPRSNNL